MINEKKIWPRKGKFEEIKSNASQKISLEIKNVKMNKVISIQLWEHDTFFDDHLGSFEFLIDSTGDNFVTDLKRAKPNSPHKYCLIWSSKVNESHKNFVPQ